MTEVDFSSNSIEDITNLTGLPHLRKIDLSHNLIANIESLHTKIGRVGNVSFREKIEFRQFSLIVNERWQLKSAE